MRRSSSGTLPFAVLLALIGVSGLGATCTSDQPPAPTRIEVPSDPVSNQESAEMEGIDLRRAPPPHRADAARILKESFCYCGCARTVASCLANRGNCPCVRCSERVADFVLEAFASGADTARVESLILATFSENYNAAPTKFDLTDQARKGAPDGAYTLVEFADFNCGHCKEAFREISAFIQSHPETSVAYFYFPLSGFGQSSVDAALAAEAARKQGKFWAMAEALFEHQRAFERPQLLAYAKDLGLDLKKFEQDLDSEETRSAVLADKRLGEELGIEGTPALFLNGRPIGSAYDEDSLSFRLQMERDRADCR